MRLVPWPEIQRVLNQEPRPTLQGEELLLAGMALDRAEREHQTRFSVPERRRLVCARWWYEQGRLGEWEQS